MLIELEIDIDLKLWTPNRPNFLPHQTPLDNSSVCGEDPKSQTFLIQINVICLSCALLHFIKTLMIELSSSNVDLNQKSIFFF